MTAFDPIREERGWRFNAEDTVLGPDPVDAWDFLSEACAATDPKFSERIVPVGPSLPGGQLNRETAD